MIDDKALWELVHSLTLEEKCSLLSGADAWTTKPIPAKNIPVLRMADGPHGVRREDYRNRKLNGGNSHRATCFPPQVALACSWSPELAHRIGQAMGEECLSLEVGLLLGPGVNIKRTPLGGRNFEYYSEDPLLAGELAAGLINGLQSVGVGASLKHYAVNSQERYRMNINAAVDERALFDIYLKAFEIAVKKAQPATIMASYNRIDGRYATENRRLLTDILRLRFGFKGAVISDWSAVYNRVEGVQAGLDLEMPASGRINDYEVLRAVREGRMAEDALDTACWNILRLVMNYNKQGQGCPKCDFEGHHALAVEALEKSAVLLKNDGFLPLGCDETIAVIGEMAAKPHYQGGGSSIVNPMKLQSFVNAMRADGRPFVYEPGYEGTETTERLLTAAEAAARKADKVLLFLGLPDLYDCEGYDREHLRLPESQLRLLAAVTAACPNVGVVLCCGGPVEAPWLAEIRSLLCLYLGGEGIGEATINLLYGAANPGGKLAESWPLALEDTPAYHHFPMGPNEVTYNESIFVGYRYYATAGQPVLFPFGHGLSYTSYEYSGLALKNGAVAPGGDVEASFTLKNTGSADGEEIAQAYLARKSSAAFQPARELKAFTRVPLKAGEETRVSLRIPYADLGFHDAASGQSVVEAGRYELLVGPSSETLPLAAVFEAAGVTLKPEEASSAKGPYGRVENNRFAAENFAALYKKRFEDNRPPKKGEYTYTTPLRMMTGSFWGRFAMRAATALSLANIRFSTDRAANAKAARQTAGDLPFKNIILTGIGFLTRRGEAALLDMVNGRGGLGRFVASFFGKRPYWRAFKNTNK